MSTGILLLGQLMFLVIFIQDRLPHHLPVRIKGVYFKNGGRERGKWQEKPEENAPSLCCVSGQGTKWMWNNIISKQAMARSRNCSGGKRAPVQTTQALLEAMASWAYKARPVHSPDSASSAVWDGFALIFLITLCKDKGLAHVAVWNSCRWRSAYLKLLLGLGMKRQGKKLYAFCRVFPTLGSVF